MENPTLLLRQATVSRKPTGDFGSPASQYFDSDSGGDEDAVDLTVASLHELQPSLTKCIVGVLQPQLQGLNHSLHILKKIADGQGSSKGPPSATSVGTASAVASAVSEALGPRFDNLLTTRTPIGPTAQWMCKAQVAQPPLPDPAHIDDMHKENSSSFAASLANELLPTVRGRATEVIDNIVRSKLGGTYPTSSSWRSNGSGCMQAPFGATTFYQDEQNLVFTLPTPSSGSRNTSRKRSKKATPAQLTLPLPLPSSGSTLGQPSPVSTLGQVQRTSSMVRNKQPRRAFVVNFRRLVQVQKFLSLVHLIIKTTAIATLTLVSASYWTDLLFSITFVVLVLALYGFHEIRHDRMDIEDYRHLANLLEDDIGERDGEVIENPNRLLKALSLSSNHRRRFRAILTIIISSLTILVMWTNVIWAWASPPKDGAFWLGVFDDHDVSVLAAQLLIGSVMVGFHVLYELVYWRETQCVMPWDSTQDGPWDPRAKHGRGLHLSHRWFGLPSMWFTSREAYDDLRLWITLSLSKSQPSFVVTKIFPEEMALYALNPHNASNLQKTLKTAKLFSRAQWEFFTRARLLAGEHSTCNVMGSTASSSTSSTPKSLSRKPIRSLQVGEDPEELNIELALFDRSTGQYLEPHHHAEYLGSLMKLIKTPQAPRLFSGAVDPWAERSLAGSRASSFVFDSRENTVPDTASREATHITFDTTHRSSSHDSDISFDLGI